MYVLGFVLLFFGVSMLGGGAKSDRRFKTGYKGNRLPSPSIQRAGWVLLLLGIGCWGLGSMIDDDHKKQETSRRLSEHPPEQPPPPVEPPALVTGLQVCLSQHDPCGDPRGALRTCFKQSSLKDDIEEACLLGDAGRKMPRAFICIDALNEELVHACKRRTSNKPHKPNTTTSDPRPSVLDRDAPNPVHSNPPVQLANPY